MRTRGVHSEPRGSAPAGSGWTSRNGPPPRAMTRDPMLADQSASKPARPWVASARMLGRAWVRAMITWAGSPRATSVTNRTSPAVVADPAGKLRQVVLGGGGLQIQRGCRPAWQQTRGRRAVTRNRLHGRDDHQQAKRDPERAGQPQRGGKRDFPLPLGVQGHHHFLRGERDAALRAGSQQEDRRRGVPDHPLRDSTRQPGAWATRAVGTEQDEAGAALGGVAGDTQGNVANAHQVDVPGDGDPVCRELLGDPLQIARRVGLAGQVPFAMDAGPARCAPARAAAPPAPAGAVPAPSPRAGPPRLPANHRGGPGACHPTARSA